VPNQIAYEEGYFALPERPGEPPLLLGTECRACGERFYPRRAVCARCLSDDTADTSLGPRGTLYTWTFLHVPGFGEHKTGQPGYAAGQIDLREGPRVQAVLEGGPGDFAIGMEMEMTLAVVATDKEGREVVMYRFRKVAGDAGGAR
jgi:uncharacterized OB-fold protein